VSAGPQAQTLGEAIAEVEAHYPPDHPLEIVETLDDAMAWKPSRHLTTEKQARIFQGLRHYLPFSVFDNQRLMAELGPLVVPGISSYLPGLFSQLTERDSLAEAEIHDEMRGTLKSRAQRAVNSRGLFGHPLGWFLGRLLGHWFLGRWFLLGFLLRRHGALLVWLTAEVRLSLI
jgi:hypothetical protein